MKLHVISRIGEPPLELDASQFLAFNDDGTPIVVAAEYGTQGAISVCHAGEGQEKFNRMLHNLGYGRHKVIVDRLSLPQPPSGASLISKPGGF
jgi:hypothetical protein